MNDKPIFFSLWTQTFIIKGIFIDNNAIYKSYFFQSSIWRSFRILLFIVSRSSRCAFKIFEYCINYLVEYDLSFLTLNLHTCNDLHSEIIIKARKKFEFSTHSIFQKFSIIMYYKHHIDTHTEIRSLIRFLYFQVSILNITY